MAASGTGRIEPDVTDIDRFHELDRLFQAVCELPVERREARLIELAPTDAKLRVEVLELLAIESRAGAVDPLSAGAGLEEIEHIFAERRHEPEELAGYRILRRLGEGGMGVVYEAEQRSPRRLVALKVLRPGLATPDLVRRFEFEAQALGRLRHPGIAQIYEAGVAPSPTGPRPFFAMEFVRGVTLGQWATGKGVREKLAMVASICDAVQHAHTKGVLHRDLKPANILVTEEGLVKVLDFGVARAVDPELVPETRKTLEGQIVGTLPYMSPEQAGGESSEIDTRSDVYALGVVLYELLSGRVPHDVSGKGLMEAARVIRDEEPTRLASLEPKTRGDIDTIVRTAISKDKARRYQTAQAMGEDLRRYLDGQTITARPTSAVYQLRRLARRHMPVTIASGVALVSLIGAIIGVSIALTETIEQREQAKRHAAIANAVSTFFNDEVLAAADPWSNPDPDASVVEALERAVDRVEGRFENEPIVEAAIRQSAGRTLGHLGRYDRAQAEIEHAVELLRDDPYTEPMQIAEAEAALGLVLGDSGAYAESLVLLDRAVDTFEHHLGPDASITQEHTNSLVLVHIDLAEFEQARAINQNQLDRIDSGRIATQGLAITALSNAGAIEYKTGNFDEAASYYERVVELAADHYGESHPETIAGIASLGLIYQRLGRTSESLELNERGVAGYTSALGAEHPYTLTARNNLALLLTEMGQEDRARAEFEEVLNIRRQALGETHPDTMVSMITTARHLSKIGAFEEAESLGLKGIALMEQELGTDHPYTVIGYQILCTHYENAGQPEQAEHWRVLGEGPSKAPGAR